MIEIWMIQENLIETWWIIPEVKLENLIDKLRFIFLDVNSGNMITKL